MKREVVILALLGWGLTSTSWAAYTIDGSLSDWGVTPFSNWVPNPPASYTQTDDINFYNAVGYDDGYDVEAMYFASDAQKFYFAVVASYGIGKTDLGLDLNGDMTISAHGVVTGLEYAVHLAGPDMGQVILNPTWMNTTFWEWPDGWQGSPYDATGGTLVGSASVAVVYYPAMESGTYIVEGSVPRNIFPGDGDAGDLVGLHYSVWCGNDSINLVGGVFTPVVPAPGAIVLGSLGLGLVGWLRRRKML